MQPTHAPLRTRRTRNEEVVVNFLAYVQYDPTLITRKISNDLVVSKNILHEIFQENKNHPIHIVLHQRLKDTNYDSRLIHCHNNLKCCHQKSCII